MMTNLKTLFAAGAIAAAFAGNAGAAGYIKFDGVDGEAKAAACGEEQAAQRQRPAGRPSERDAAEEAETCAKEKGNVETTWAVEKGAK